MTNVYSIICSTLAALGYTVREQGSYGKDEKLPEAFVTYFILDQPDVAHADNRPTRTMTKVQVVVWATDPAIIQAANDNVKAVMLPAGFLRAGGTHLPLDKDTGHYGYTSIYNYY